MYTLTLNVSGVYQVPYTVATPCGFSTCHETRYDTYSHDATVSSNGATCVGAQTCTYSFNAGTEVTIGTNRSANASGPSTFVMTSDQTFTVS